MKLNTLWIRLAGGLALVAIMSAPMFAQRVDSYRAQIRGGEHRGAGGGG